MTLIAPVSRERTAQSKPAAICSPPKPKRCVIIGFTSTAPLSSKLTHSGYCAQRGTRVSGKGSTDWTVSRVLPVNLPLADSSDRLDARSNRWAEYAMRTQQR